MYRKALSEAREPTDIAPQKLAALMQPMLEISGELAWL